MWQQSWRWPSADCTDVWHLLPLQLVMCTAPTVGSLTEPLQYIYSTLFLEHVAKNPLYTIGEAFL